MPRKNKDYAMTYDLTAWRQRLGKDGQALPKSDAAVTLGISYAQYLRLEASGTAQKTVVWACFGIEQAVRQQREQAALEAAKSVAKIPKPEGE